MNLTTYFNIPKENPVLNIMYKEIPGYNGYYKVGDDGSIWNPKKQMRFFVINSGYAAIILTFNLQRKHHLIHRLVAEAFIANPKHKKEVNHIDGIKLKNNAYNLEWCTSAENKQHAYDIGLKEYNYPTKGIKLSNKSKYHNVGWDTSRNRWRAAIRLNGKTYYQKRFKAEIDAALHVNWALDQLNIIDRPRNIIHN